MSAYSHVTIIERYADAVADIVCGNKLMELKEIGIFFDVAPKPEYMTVEAAIRFDGKHLGLASWSLTPLYVEGRKQLLVDGTNFRAASAMLAAVPEYTSAWNVRKLSLSPDQVAAELQFSKLILMRSPKSSETWSHRSWVLRRFGCNTNQIKEELTIATTAASRETHNYYAGVHRLRVTAHAPDSVLLSELDFSRKWLRSHVSDSSAWWYHRHLLTSIQSTDPSPLKAELAFSAELFRRYRKEYQSVNIHWDWVMALPTSHAFMEQEDT